MTTNRSKFDAEISNRNYSRRTLQLALIPDLRPRFEDEASALLDHVLGFPGSSRVATPVVLDHLSSAPLATFRSFEVATIPDPSTHCASKYGVRHIGMIGHIVSYSKAKKRKNCVTSLNRSSEGFSWSRAGRSVDGLETKDQNIQSQPVSAGAEKLASLEHIKTDPCYCFYWLARLIIWGGRHSR
ncbi:hypothetical protein [Sphingorhabdus sp. EL138]|uniref:hypothetical protein n=1 Tax=Sphingorhabdus sp. EL138 TaxID=2073156 RepID=UPI0013A5A75C|nr:hypothetical protein [Sphingorhabdus sp. EL138]